MPMYTYRAIDPKGKKQGGVIEAVSETLAKQQLRAQGVMVTHLTTKVKNSSRQNLTGQHRIAFSVQLAQLLQAGVPLYESLVTIEEQYRSEPYHRVLHSLTEQIKAGISLSQAMKNFPESFDHLYCSLVAAGEAVGNLGGSLEKLATLLNKQMKVKKQIANAMVYPAILGSFALLVIGLLLGFVVPSIEGIFEDRPVGGITRSVLSLSHGFRSYGWFVLPSLVVGILWGIRHIRSPKGRLWLQRTVLKMPLLRTLFVQAAVTRFSRTMATLQQGGLSMMESLRISRKVMNNVVLEEEMKRAEEQIVGGKSLSGELSRSTTIPPMVSRMVAVGEESGNLVPILHKIADMYEEEMEKSIEKVLTLFQPVILLVMGMLIGIVLIAILLPLTDIGSLTME